MSNNQRSFGFLAIRFMLAAVMAVVFVSVSSVGVGADNEKATDKKGGRMSAPAVPSASTTLVLSQVYGGGGSNTGSPAYTNDYVEIKNVSSVTQSLDGKALQYGAATGQFGGSTGTNIVTLPNVSLAPGQYYLVVLGTAGTAGAAIPVAADLTSGTINMSGTSGKIALTTTNTWLACGGVAPGVACTFPNAAIIDWVAYGAAGNVTAGNGEGGTSVNNNTALTTAQGGVRNGTGCTDTDNNNLDFTVVAPPVPRNTATTASPCSTTAAGVGISGRVTTADGRGITNAIVTIMGNSLPEPRTVITGRRGAYIFDDLEPGETYIVTVRSRRFTFSNPNQVITLNDNMANADFVADGGTSRGR